MDAIDTIQCGAAMPAGMAATPSSAANGTASLLRRCLEVFSLWHQKRESRRILRDLTNDQLRDIGLTRRETQTEVAKSFFWD